MDSRVAQVANQYPKPEQVRISKKKGENIKKSDEQSFEPQYHQIRKMGFRVNKSKITVGQWSYQENQVYLQYMIDNFADFLTQKSRRKTKVFFRLSKVLKKRTPDQCRSHHQKLQLKYKDDLYSIIGQVSKKIQKSMAQEYVDYHHRLHTETFEKMRQLNRTGCDEEDQKQQMINGEWFQIKRISNSFKITINSQSIEQWISQQ